MTTIEIIAAIAALSYEDRTVVLTGAYGADLDQAAEELKRRAQQTLAWVGPEIDRLKAERDRALTAAENVAATSGRLAHAADFAVEELGKARVERDEARHELRALEWLVDGEQLLSTVPCELPRRVRVFDPNENEWRVFGSWTEAATALGRKDEP